MKDNFEEDFTAYMTKVESRMWLGIGAATLIIFVWLLWGISHRPIETKGKCVHQIIQQ